MDFQLQNKVAIVGGGSRGIGFSSAELLLKEGAKVAFFSRNLESVQQALEQLSAKGVPTDNVLGLAADYADRASLDKLVTQVEERWGGIDIFVGSSGGPKPSSATALTPATLSAALESNLVGITHLTSRLTALMVTRNFGRVVFVTTSGVVQPIPGLVTSNIARAGLTAYAKTLAAELAAYGVTVNTVMPGLITTDRLRQVIELTAQRNGISVDEQRAQDWKNIPAGRYGTPQEIANLIVFLCSGLASYVTGTKIAVDGGLLKAV